MKRHFTLLIAVILTGIAFGQNPETAQQKQMAEQMAKYMNNAWEVSPESGKANLRFLFIKEGQPYSGIISIHGRFKIKAEGKQTHLTSLNPNTNGRWVLEELEPGTYNLYIEGQEEMKDFKWEKIGYAVKAGESPIIEIDLSE